MTQSKEYRPGLVSQILASKKKTFETSSDSKLTSLFTAPKLTPPPNVSPQLKKTFRVHTPGIGHESLMIPDQTDRTQLKRKKSSNAEEESDKEGFKEIKRPRRDRLKKVDEKRTVFVGNVPLSCNKKTATPSKKLAKLFREFGDLESIRFRCAPVADLTLPKRAAVIKKEFHEQRHNIAAYVCFAQETAAQAALKLNGQLVGGLHLRVDLACKEKHDNARSVFVGNLPFAIEEETVRSHFADCGEIDNVRVVRDRKTNLGKGFCYVLFKSKDSVSLAMKLQGTKLEGRELRIERCSEQPKKPKFNKSAAMLKDKGAETLRERHRPWGPSNTSAAFKGLKTKTSVSKKLAKRKKYKKKKVDEVSRVLGPASQPPVVAGKKGLRKQGQLKGKTKRAKSATKAKKIKRN